MDRPVNPEKPDLATLARSLLSPAKNIEDPRPSGPTATQSLNLLGTLESVARASMEEAKPIPPQPRDAKTQAQLEARAALNRALRGRGLAQQAAPGASQKPTLQAPHAQEIPAPVFSTKRPEYQSALQDQSVIEALLDFHRNQRKTPPAERKPGNAFVQPEHPKIEAKPKPKTLGARRAPGIAYPVLRPHRSDS